MARTQLQHWVKDKKTRTAWCGGKVSGIEPPMPWPITCTKCCRAIRKGRLRQIELESMGAKHRSKKLSAELEALSSASWPMNRSAVTRVAYKASSDPRAIRGWPRTLVTARGKPLPKNLTFTEKDVEQIVQFVAYAKPNDLKRLWITEDEERQILNALDHFDKPVVYRDNPSRPVGDKYVEN